MLQLRRLFLRFASERKLARFRFSINDRLSFSAHAFVDCPCQETPGRRRLLCDLSSHPLSRLSVGRLQVSTAYGPFWGWMEGYASWVSGVADNSLCELRSIPVKFQPRCLGWLFPRPFETSCLRRKRSTSRILLVFAGSVGFLFDLPAVFHRRTLPYRAAAFTSKHLYGRCMSSTFDSVQVHVASKH